MGHHRLSKRIAILIFLLSLSSGLLCPLDAFTIGISPPRVEVVVEPGQTVEGKISVLGRFDRPTRIRATAGFWYYERDGKVVFRADQPGERSLSSWLAVVPAEFVLNGETPQIVRYRLKVPADITGSYWGVLHFRTLAEKAGPSQGSTLSFQGGVTTILISSTKRGAVRNGALTDLVGSWSAEGLALRATFENRGNLIVKARGRFELIDPKTGKTTAKIPIAEALVLPGGVRDLTAKYAEQLVPGPYLIRAVVDYGNPQAVAAQRVIKVGS